MIKKLKTILVLLFISFTVSAQTTRWVDIGEGTYEQGFLFPYKIKFSVPFGVRDIDDIKLGLHPMKFEINWLLPNATKDIVSKVFFDQLKEKYENKESFRLSKNLIHYFLNKLPAIIKHDKWLFVYYPDVGTKLFIHEEKIHHLVGAEFNRALIGSWLDKNPVLTSHLFNRLLKIQK
jgi:hypothetical protein